MDSMKNILVGISFYIGGIALIVTLILIFKYFATVVVALIAMALIIGAFAHLYTLGKGLRQDWKERRG